MMVTDNDSRTHGFQGEFICFAGRPVGGHSSAPLESGNASVDYNKKEGKDLYQKASSIAGICLFVLGSALLFGRWFTLGRYFAGHSGIAVPFATIVAAAILIWAGMMLLASRAFITTRSF
jgi:hypothetical protein